MVENTHSSKPSLQRIQRRALLAFTLVLAAILLYLALRGVTWAEVLATLRQGRPEYLAIVFVTSSISLFLRGLRWGTLVSAEKKLPPVVLFATNMIGYMGNQFLPARSGEAIRSVVLSKKGGISVSFVLATALTERVMDVIILLVTAALVLPVIGRLPEWMVPAVRVMAALGGAAMLALLLIPYWEGSLYRLIAWLPMTPAWQERLQRVASQFLHGARSFVHPGRAASFLGFSVVIWLLDGLGAVLTCQGLHLTLTLPQAMLLLVALGFSSAIPSTPGYVGVYQFVAVNLLPIFGFTRSQSLTYILVNQALTMAFVALWGFIGLWYLGLSRKDLSKPV